MQIVDNLRGFSFYISCKSSRVLERDRPTLKRNQGGLRWTGGTQQAALGNNSQLKTPKISNNKHSNFTNYQAYTSQTPQLQLVASVRPSLMDPMSRKRSVHNCQRKVKSGKVVRFRIFRNASDGDSGFDSALSSRSSSISLDQVRSYITNRMFIDLVYHQCGGSF